MKLYTDIAGPWVRVLQIALLTCLMILSFNGYAKKQGITKASLQEIFKQELSFIKGSEQLAVDELWAIKNISQITKDKKLEKFIKQRTEDSFLLLLDSGAPKIPLSEETRIGGRKLFNFMSAPFGEPEKRAISYVNQFFEYSATG